jgi:hypothetical protein
MPTITDSVRASALKGISPTVMPPPAPPQLWAESALVPPPPPPIKRTWAIDPYSGLIQIPEISKICTLTLAPPTALSATVSHTAAAVVDSAAAMAALRASSLVTMSITH